MGGWDDSAVWSMGGGALSERGGCDDLADCWTVSDTGSGDLFICAVIDTGELERVGNSGF